MLFRSRFFWEQDRKKPLAEHAQKLANIVFHEKLGTLADKVERVAKLARWLVESGVVKPTPAHPELVEGPHASVAQSASTNSAQAVEELAAQAQQAAELCKADLVTEMVGEFPELQGLMGGYYARAEGLPDAVADAIRDHYKPVGQGDEVPTAPVTVAVSLADKLDTLAGFFLADLLPTGSKDPFALRRAAIAVIEILTANNIRVGLIDPIHMSHASLAGRLNGYEWRQRFENLVEARIAAGDPMSDIEHTRTFEDFIERARSPEETAKFGARSNASFRKLIGFFADRLKVQQREAGVRHDLIDAVFALGAEDDLVRLLARVHALQAFIGTEDGVNLLAGYKRAANILKKEAFEAADNAPIPLSYTPEPAEKALVDSLAEAGPRAATAVEAEDFAGAMAALASLRGPIDAFFDSVTVNDPAPEKRLSRLALLDSFRAAVHKVADFSKIEG